MLRKLFLGAMLLLGLATPTPAAPFALYASNQNANTVVAFNAAGNPTLFASSGLSAPQDIAFDAAGNLYVANDNATGIVRRFSPTGTDLGTFANLGFANATGVAFDAAGNLYVSNFNLNTVRRFSPTGTDLGNFATTGLNQPVGMAFAPGQGGLPLPNFPQAPAATVPEPASLLLAGLGLGGLALVRRLRRCA